MSLGKMDPIEQSRLSLKIANQKRIARSQVRKRMKERRVTIRVALTDPSADTAFVIDMLRFLPWVSYHRAKLMMRTAHIHTGTLCADLTERQLAALEIDWCGRDSFGGAVLPE